MGLFDECESGVHYSTRPDDFREYDEFIDVNYKCPDCCYKWSDPGGEGTINESIFLIHGQNQLGLFDNITVEISEEIEKRFMSCPRCYSAF